MHTRLAKILFMRTPGTSPSELLLGRRPHSRLYLFEAEHCRESGE